ncbi:ATP-grasp domain-containing protein [Sphingomonas sp. SUN019]|uniref:ATP-grasp domain-containing protein n=1 Tax=Sphingomonas sp. SUN019 TaxID=2937788 RepID=UPI002164A79C|nr:ATP-grasp domain-containing protein [Sphingomonas sp. SUN019]UVO51679.1 ATP-grasp domain-containing protein [Sphingomonas sp. SUN019]
MVMPVTLLLTSAGRRVALLEAFRHGAEAAGIDLTVLACDLAPDMSAACRVADRRFAVPRVDDPDYITALLAICRDHNVGLLVPTIDTELLALANAAESFASIGCHVAISAPAVIDIARDKLATATFLDASGIPSPRTTALAALRAGCADCGWPAILKPRHGSASRGLAIARGPDDLPQTEQEPMIVQQLLSGEEWTVNLYFDDHGALRTVVPHRRLQVRAGEVEKGVVQRDPALQTIAERIADHLPGPRGVLCFQAMRDAGGAFSVFEINARFGGGYPLADRAGATFARWLLERCTGLPDTAHDGWTAGVTMLRYDAAIFIDRCA